MKFTYFYLNTSFTQCHLFQIYQELKISVILSVYDIWNRFYYLTLYLINLTLGIIINHETKYKKQLARKKAESENSILLSFIYIIMLVK